MAEKDDLIPKFEDTEPLFEDTEEIVEGPKKMSNAQFFLKGAEQGMTLGFADELAGGIQSGMDKLAQLGVPGLLPEGVTQTPDQQTQELLSQGFKGDLPSTYEGARNEARKEYKQAEQDNPGMYIGGNIAGGALTAAIPGGVGAKLMQPLGSASKGAKLGEKILTAGVNAMPVGATIGAGMSEADNIKDLITDTTEGALLSGALGGSLTGAGLLAGGAVSKTGDIIKTKTPSIYRAYEKGKEGIKTYGEDFRIETNERLQNMTNKLKEFVVSKRNELTKKNDEIINKLGKQIDSTEKDIISYRKALTEKQSDRLEKAKLGYAKQIESKLLDQKAKIGKTYDAIEDQVKDSNVLFDVRQPIADLGENLQINGLLPDQAAAIQGRFAPYFERTDLTLPELKQMKILINRMAESNNPAVKGAAKKMYGQVINNQIGSIEQAGLQDVASNLKNANQKYFKLLDLEENFIGDLSQDRVLKQTLTDNQTLSTLDKLVKSDAKSLNTQDILQKKSDSLSPEVGNLINNITEDLQLKSKNLSNIPSESEMIGASGEIQRLKALLGQAKVKPEAKTQMDALMQVDEKGINDYIGNNLKNINNPVLEPNRQNIENVLKEYEMFTGKSLNKEASDLIKDTELVKDAAEEIRGMISPRSLGLIETAGQYPANMLGRAIKNFKPSTIKNVFKGDIKDIYSNIRRFNTPEADVYAKQLETAIQNGTQESKNAVLFSLMQQPAFRQMMNINEAEKEK